MRIGIALSFVTLFCSGLQASPIFHLQPVGGAVSSSPGGDTGWGFSLSADITNWISVVSSSLVTENNPAFGVYTDFIGISGGPVNAVLAPRASAWNQTFDFAAGQGVGSYSIDPGAAIGDSDSGMITIQYEIFSADPNVCSSCGTGFGEFSTPFLVTATAPEPWSFWLTGIGVTAFAYRRMRLRIAVRQ